MNGLGLKPRNARLAELSVLRVGGLLFTIGRVLPDPAPSTVVPSHPQGSGRRMGLHARPDGLPVEVQASAPASTTRQPRRVSMATRPRFAASLREKVPMAMAAAGSIAVRIARQREHPGQWEAAMAGAAAVDSPDAYAGAVCAVAGLRDGEFFRARAGGSAPPAVDSSLPPAAWRYAVGSGRPRAGLPYTLVFTRVASVRAGWHRNQVGALAGMLHAGVGLSSNLCSNVESGGGQASGYCSVW
jgi:hypothetical protein